MTELVRVTRGVWRPPSAVSDLRGRLAAVLSVLPDSTVVVGTTAALLHGLWLPEQIDPRIQVVLRPRHRDPAGLARSIRAEVRGRRQRLRPEDVTHLDWIRVTTIERTWFDLAEVLSLPDLVAAGDCALRAGASLARLTALVDGADRRRGVVTARAALPLLNARSRSRPESHLRVAVVTAGLPTPAVNVPVFDSLGQWLAEPDLSYDDVKLALEYNGADHAAVRRQRRDITRTLDLLQRGDWFTLTFGPAEVFGRPDEVVAVVRLLRTERGRP